MNAIAVCFSLCGILILLRGRFSAYVKSDLSMIAPIFNAAPEILFRIIIKALKYHMVCWWISSNFIYVFDIVLHVCILVSFTTEFRQSLSFLFFTSMVNSFTCFCNSVTFCSSASVIITVFNSLKLTSQFCFSTDFICFKKTCPHQFVMFLSVILWTEFSLFHEDFKLVGSVWLRIRFTPFVMKIHLT